MNNSPVQSSANANASVNSEETQYQWMGGMRFRILKTFTDTKFSFERPPTLSRVYVKVITRGHVDLRVAVNSVVLENQRLLELTWTTRRYEFEFMQYNPRGYSSTIPEVALYAIDHPFDVSEPKGRLTRADVAGAREIYAFGHGSGPKNVVDQVNNHRSYSHYTANTQGVVEVPDSIFNDHHSDFYIVKKEDSTKEAEDYFVQRFLARLTDRAPDFAHREPYVAGDSVRCAIDLESVCTRIQQQLPGYTVRPHMVCLEVSKNPSPQ